MARRSAICCKDTAVDGIPAERAAWVALASVLLNLDEFITRE